MPKWKVNRAGPQWLMDQAGRLFGYLDDRGVPNKLVQMSAGAGALVALAKVPASTVGVRVRASADKSAVVVLYQYDQWENKMPLGFVVCNLGGVVSKVFALEPDAVYVSWEEGGRYYAQTVAGIPSENGVLTYLPQLSAPDSVEFI